MRALRAAPWIVAAASLIAAVSLWRHSPSPDDDNAQVVRYQVTLPPSSLIGPGGGNPVAIAPHGKHLAYSILTPAGERRLFIRAADELRLREVPSSLNARHPVFSPDGRWLMFTATDEMRKASVDGGAAGRVMSVSRPARIAWTNRGVLVLSMNGRLAAAPEDGGAFVPFANLDSTNGETSQENPVAPGDGEHLLYTSHGEAGVNALRIGITDIATGRSTRLPVQGSYALGMVGGLLVYGTSTGQVMAVPFDIQTRRISGTPTLVLDQVTTDANGEVYANLSADGAITYVASANRRVLSVLESGVPRALIAEPMNAAWPRLSPNGDRVALTVFASGRSDVWLFSLPTGPLVKLTTDGNVNDRPEWTPDGKSVIFRSNRGPRNALWIQSADGVGGARQFFGDPGARIDEGVLSNDGRYLLVQRDSVGQGDIYYREMSGDTALKVIEATPGGDVSARFSPDGKWVAYSSAGAGGGQLFVKPFPALDERIQVSLEAGGAPVWSRDGSKIYYTNGRELLVANVRSQPKFTVVSRDRVVGGSGMFVMLHADFDVMPDNRSILYFRTVDEDEQVVVVHDWWREVRARVGR